MNRPRHDAPLAYRLSRKYTPPEHLSGTPTRFKLNSSIDLYNALLKRGRSNPRAGPAPEPTMLPALSIPRLALRPTTSADLDALLTLWTDPEVRRFFFDDAVITWDRATEILADGRALAPEGLGLWGLRRRASTALIGCVGLWPATTITELDPRLVGAVEPLIALGPSEWGRGEATEALAEVIAYALGPLGPPRLAAAAVNLPNAASRRLLERLGFEALGEWDGPRHRLRTYTLTPTGFTNRTGSEMPRSETASPVPRLRPAWGSKQEGSRGDELRSIEVPG